MKIFWRIRHQKGPADIVKVKEGREKSRAANDDMDIRVGTNEVIFDPVDYGIDGFTLSLEELEIMVAELKLKRSA